MARKRKRKDGLMALILAAFVLFCAIKIVDIQQNISEKEDQLRSLESQISQQENENKELERQLEAGTQEENLGRVAFEQYGYGYVDEHIYIDSSGA